jgi:hypothetical protein
LSLLARGTRVASSFPAGMPSAKFIQISLLPSKKEKKKKKKRGKQIEKEKKKQGF